MDTTIVGFPPDGRGRVGTFVVTAPGCGADGGAGRQVGADGIIEAGRAPIGTDEAVGTNIGIGANRGLTSKTRHVGRVGFLVSGALARTRPDFIEILR